MQMRNHHSKPGADEAEDETNLEPPSKSSLKREMHALQGLGAELVELSDDRLKRVPMPDRLRDAILDYKRFPKHEARRRQLQFIGRLMRHIDSEPIQAQLEVFKGASKLEVARQHRLERLRDAFLEDEKRISDILEHWPDADVQYLRTLRRNALKEREQAKPPRSYREIFRVLRDLDRAASDPVFSDEQVQDKEDS